MTFPATKTIARTLVLAAFLAAGTAAAQTAPGDSQSQLVDRQKALFEQMLEQPDNIQLMFDYAEVSMRLRDYEPAISTLERLLIFRQDLPRVRLELAVAYFNLGSYEASKLYFAQVLNDPRTSDEVRSKIQPYIDAIAQRTAQSSFSLVANLGATYSTNANLAPNSSTVTIGGNPNVNLQDDGLDQDDFGVRLLVRGRHVYDLQRPNSDAWITEGSLFGLKYGDVDRGDTLFLSGQTGPRLALANEQNAPTLRPYVGAQYLFNEDDTVYYAGKGGVQYGHRLSSDWSAFSDFNIGYFDFEESRDDEDRVSFDGSVGAAHQLAPGLVARSALVGSYDLADEDHNSNIEVGGRTSALYSYDSGFGFAERKWALSGFADVRYRWFDEADPAIDPDEVREDLDLRLGASHLFAITRDLGVQADVETYNRFSNIQNFDLENVSLSLSFQYRM